MREEWQARKGELLGAASIEEGAARPACPMRSEYVMLLPDTQVKMQTTPQGDGALRAGYFVGAGSKRAWKVGQAGDLPH